MKNKISIKERWILWNNRRTNDWYTLVGVSLLSALISIAGQTIWTISVMDYTVPMVSVAHAESLVELSVRDYVLNEVEKAGIDKFDAYAVIKCESNFNPEATMINYNNRNGVDRGVWQLSDKHQKHISNSCAYDYKCATEKAIEIIKKQGWKPWVCAKKLGLK